MKAIENISEKLEKVMLRGLERNDSFIEIKMFQVEIRLYYIEGSIFVYARNRTRSTAVNIYEVDSQESYYLYDTIKGIMEKASGYGSEADSQAIREVYEKVIDFCKKIKFDYKDFEEALENLK